MGHYHIDRSQRTMGSRRLIRKALEHASRQGEETWIAKKLGILGEGFRKMHLIGDLPDMDFSEREPWQ